MLLKCLVHILKVSLRSWAPSPSITKLPNYNKNYKIVWITDGSRQLESVNGQSDVSRESVLCVTWERGCHRETETQWGSAEVSWSLMESVSEFSLGTTGLCFRARSGMSHGEGMGTWPEVRERTEGWSDMMPGVGGGALALKALFDLQDFVCQKS